MPSAVLVVKCPVKATAPQVLPGQTVQLVSKGLIREDGRAERDVSLQNQSEAFLPNNNIVLTKQFSGACSQPTFSLSDGVPNETVLVTSVVPSRYWPPESQRYNSLVDRGRAEDTQG